jgi:hypothetical protein
VLEIVTVSPSETSTLALALLDRAVLALVLRPLVPMDEATFEARLTRIALVLAEAQLRRGR